MAWANISQGELGVLREIFSPRLTMTPPEMLVAPFVAAWPGVWVDGKSGLFIISLACSLVTLVEATGVLGFAFGVGSSMKPATFLTNSFARRTSSGLGTRWNMTR